MELVESPYVSAVWCPRLWLVNQPLSIITLYWPEVVLMIDANSITIMRQCCLVREHFVPLVRNTGSNTSDRLELVQGVTPATDSS